MSAFTEAITTGVYHGVTIGFAKQGIITPEAKSLLENGEFDNLNSALSGVRDALVELGYLRKRRFWFGYQRTQKELPSPRNFRR
ncbi:hypothetical protein D3C87_2051050 [compost metagenome]